MTYSNFMSSIKTTGKDIWNDEKPSSYSPYLIQRGLFSNDASAIKILNTANQRIKDRELHYKFLLHSLPKNVKYVAQSKKKKDPLTVKYLSVVRKYFGYNDMKAKDAIKILSLHQLEQIETSFYKGGVERLGYPKKLTNIL
jgi:hypothetical protein